MTRTDYEVTTEVGTVVFTTPLSALAKRWIVQNRNRFGPLQIDEVTRSETRRRVYRTRKAEPEVVMAVMGRGK